MSFFSPKSELALVFDIASSSVSAALVRLAFGEHIRVIHSLNEPLSNQNSVDPEKLFNDMIEALKKAHADIVKQGSVKLSGTEFRHVNAKRIIYSFTSPWSATQTKTISLKKDKSFTFTRAVLEKLMSSEEEKFSVIDRRIIQTRLNGYEVKDPFGKNVREVDISYFTGIVPKSVLEKTVEVSHAIRASKYIKSFTFPLITYSYIKDSFPDERDFIQLRIGGGISDVAIIEDGLITESASFPLGYKQVIDGAATLSGITNDEIISFLKLKSEGHAELSVVEKLNPILSRSIENFVSELRKVLDKMENGSFLPQKLFLTTDFDVPGFFAQALGGSSIPLEVLILDSPINLAAVFAGRVYETEKK
jgi:cell division ATPase FtsA